MPEVRVVPVGVSAPAQVDDLLAPLAAALDGGPALLPVAPGRAGAAVLRAARLDVPVREDTALLLATSGSVGAPKIVELSAGALLASARGSRTRLGAGRWLLALPLTHVAGWQVLVRSLPETYAPLCHGPGPFDATTFGGLLRRAARDGAAVRSCSLVPTQLHRVLADPGATAAARGLTVLLGGAAAPDELLSRAREARIRVVTSYGSTETCGGCLYDGVPLPGVRTAIDPDGRLRIGGDVLASGYRDATPGFIDDDGRWFVTDDLARISDGLVRVTGRVDDVIITGGEKVNPAEVEAVLAGLPQVAEACVVGVPDADWGLQVVALVRVSTSGGGGDPSIDLASVRGAVTAALGRHCAPRRVFVVDDLPRLGIGKPDRRAAARSAGALLRGE